MTHHVTRPGSPRQRFGRGWPPSCGQDVLGGRGESAAPGQVCGSGAGDTGHETKPGRSGEAVVPLRGSGPRVVPGTACVKCEVHDPAKKSSPSCLVPGYAGPALRPRLRHPSQLAGPRLDGTRSNGGNEYQKPRPDAFGKLKKQRDTSGL